jgi:hypothetical protein
MTDSFDTNDTNFPFPPPPAPASGQALLDDNESKYLGDFFDGVSSDQFNNDFFFSKNTDGNGHDMPFDWHDLPPTFMGTTSSFGPQAQSNLNGLSDLNFGSDMNGSMGMLPEGIPPTTTPDVIAAATLLQGGHLGRSHSIAGPLFSSGEGSSSMGVPLDNHIRTASHPSSRGISSLPTHSKGGPEQYMRDTFYTDLVFGSSGRQPREPSKAVDIRWGSDAAFSTNQSFIAPAGQETVESVERELMQKLDCFEPHSSASNTRPSSPKVARRSEPARKAPGQQAPEITEEDGNGSEQVRARKRRKSSVKKETEDDEVIAAQKPVRKRRPKAVPSDQSSPVTDGQASSKRRKSSNPAPSINTSQASTAAAKSARENLTEDQKRENHIKSEQKRRTLIKEGFEDLNELVPELRGGGFSKSAVLSMAGEWLESLVKGNEALREEIRRLEGGG